MTPGRGRCPVCMYSYRLRADGTVQRHHGYSGRSPLPDCNGSGGPPVPYDPNACGGCLEYLYATPMLTEACWSVGIEVGKSGDALMREVLEAYHGNGHQEVA